MNTPWNNKQTHRNNGIPERPNAPFYWMHLPTMWEITRDEKGNPEWLPTFSTLYEIPGVQGVRDGKYGPDSQGARLAAMDRGFTILDRDLDYVSRWECKTGGYYYESVFATPKIIGGKIIWKTDRKAYNEFRRSLIAGGLIDPPDSDILDLKIEDMRRKIDRHVQNQHIPEIKTKIENIRAMIQDMELARDGKKKVKK